MRALSAALLVSAFLTQPGFAQGVKDPANTTSSSIVTSKKPEAIQSAASRPTHIRNLRTGSLPPGMAAQGVWKDGKLVAVPR